MKIAVSLLLTFAVLGVDIAKGQELQAIKLPEVYLENDKPLHKALRERPLFFL